MKNLLLLLTMITSLLFTACGNDDDITPDPVSETELITTVKLTFNDTTTGVGDDIVFIYKDIDGAGPNAPVITEGKLAKNTIYTCQVQLLNETVAADMNDPDYNINLQVSQESTDHQLFYNVADGLDMNITYADKDPNWNYIGMATYAKCNENSTGKLTVTLRHKPNKSAAGVQNGDITNAGGETDVEVTFNVVIE